MARVVSIYAQVLYIYIYMYICMCLCVCINESIYFGLSLCCLLVPLRRRLHAGNPHLYYIQKICVKTRRWECDRPGVVPTSSGPHVWGQYHSSEKVSCDEWYWNPSLIYRDICVERGASYAACAAHNNLIRTLLPVFSPSASSSTVSSTPTRTPPSPRPFHHHTHQHRGFTHLYHQKKRKI